MDVDNVARGAGGKEAEPRDHNRDWDPLPVHPEVAAAQRRIGELVAAGRLRVYLDLHNPGPDDRVHFFFGPLDYEELAPPRRTLYDRWLEAVLGAMTDPPGLQPKYRFATYVKTEEERRRVSSAWIRQQVGFGGIALSFECARTATWKSAGNWAARWPAI